MKLVTTLSFTLSFVLTVQSLSVTTHLKNEWKTYKLHYGKVYANAEEEHSRMQVYLHNRMQIAEHNRNNNAGFKLRMNKFGDLTSQEFNLIMNRFKMDYRRDKTSQITFIASANFQAPSSIDWRESGLVTAVKNQGSCGSCWAFSVTGALEGQTKRKTGTLTSLSEQNLVDCDQTSDGCGGGYIGKAFEYVKANGGIDTEQSYPYIGHRETCHFRNVSIGARCTGHVNLPSGDEKALLDAVASIGPISVAMDASQESFQFYSSGVYYDKQCSSSDLDHAVLVVGYGSENGVDYWLVKNSWGTDWGEKGYIKIERNRGNICGIATDASYPLV